MLAVFFVEEKVFTLYDSNNVAEQDFAAAASRDQVINNLWCFLEADLHAQNSQSIPGAWVYEHDSHIPQESNGNDCGIFICMFADFISLNLPLEFDSSHMPGMRLRLAQTAIELSANFTGDAKIQEDRLKEAWMNSVMTAASNKHPSCP